MFSNEGQNIVSAYSRHDITSNNKNNNLNFNTKNNLPEINTNINTQANIPTQKPKYFKLIIILISLGSALVATGIIVPIVVLSNKDDDEKIVTNNISESEYSEKSISIINSEIPYTQNNKETEEILTNIIFDSETNKLPTDSQSHEIYIEELKQTKYCIYSTLKLKCINLEHHQDIEPNDISFEFPIEGSTRKYNCDSINNNIIEKKIPSEVISGTIMLSIEN